MITNESNMAKDDSLRVGGATLFYRVRGSGPLLLILPGGDGDADTADALRNQLIDRYTVVTYDRRGMSRSEIDAPGESLTLATHSDDAHRLLAALHAAPTRIVPAVGRSAPESAPYKAAEALAAELGEQVVTFPGGHTAWLLRPIGFATKLAEILR